MTAQTEGGRPVERRFILCGLGKVGARVCEYLRAIGVPVLVVDTQCEPDDPRLGGVPVIKGDCRRQEVLEQAGVSAARGVLILTSDDLINISTALMVRRLNPDVRVVMRMFNQNLLDRLGTAVRNVFVLSTSNLTAPLLALTALTGQALGTFRVEGPNEGRRQIAELAVAAGSPLCGRSVAEVVTPRGALALAHTTSRGERQFLRDVDPQARLSAGDRLVVCGEPRALAPLLNQEAEQAAPHVYWAGFVRRHARVVWRTLSEMDLAVKICLGVFVSVLLVSTLVFHYSVRKDNFARAMFRTVSLMATGADMHMEDLPSDGLKLFASFLRIVGALLTAALTAIVTNYLLRARLGGTLEVRRIPDSGHVIVCGLGNIGFRVCEELVSYGERAVAIEVSTNSRFVATARRLGVAVVVGDATVREVLRQAHAPAARAVVACTNNELGNLEIALLARDLNPTQRVVVRLSDSSLAETLREAASIRLALSVPALAAPAFVAALFGDRVQSVFLVGGRSLVVVELVAAQEDSFLAGRALEALARDYRFLTAGFLPVNGSAKSPPVNRRLEPGDRLTVIIELADLERLLRREEPPRTCAVEVRGFALPMRAWVAQLVRAKQGLSAEAAEEVLNRVPFCLEKGMTPGEAEELLGLLHREKVVAEIAEMT